MRTLLKILGVAAVAFGVVFAWHIGTTMTPLDKYNQIQGCALRARLALEDRDAESAYPIKVRWGMAERFFRDVETSAVVSINGEPDAIIYCLSRDNELQQLMVDGEWLQGFD